MHDLSEEALCLLFHCVEQQAQRLARESLFLLVQGQTPEIKEHHMRLLTERATLGE